MPRSHALPAWATEGGCLVVGGVPLPRLAARVGSTPFFAYDRHRIADRIAELRQALPPSVHISYAIKANPMPAVVQHLARWIDGLDVASGLELRTALDTGMAPERISLAGPGKTPAEIAQAVAAGITLSVESFSQMRHAAAAGERLGIQPRLMVRVNPDFELRASGMQMGGGPKPFGVDAELVPALLRELGALGLDFEGFHVFAGSQNLDAGALAEAQRRTVEMAVGLAAHAPNPLRTLNLGGGFGIPYFPGERPLDLLAVGANLAGLVPRVAAALPGARVTLELGRFLVGESGIYVCRVLERKESRGRTFLVTDGGLHHHLAASGHFGQVVRRNYPVAIGNRLDAPAEEKVDVVGCLCTPMDVLGRDVTLPRAEVGDLVVVFQSGAYGRSASPNDFLSHEPAIEVLA